ncbi:MAG: hypothetical protein ACI81T_002175, partial [Bacteroidia bacterium]
MLNHFGSILLADSMLEGLGGIIIIAVLIFI